MNMRNIIGFVLLVIFVIPPALSSDSQQHGFADDDFSVSHGKFYISVFNCMIALPAEYVLNTRERDHFSFVKKSGGVGRISIDTYDDSIESSDKLQIVEKKIVDNLTILFIKVKWDPSMVVVIHDNKDGVRIIGDDVMLWEDMVRVCSVTK